MLRPTAIRALAYTFVGMDEKAEQDIDRAIELRVDRALLKQMVRQVKQAR